ncbi:MAG: class I SAM-dependent RNA methyltransferase [Nitrospirae bacterium]|nr:MAG: class I SAM-dependent RNA methyltransferase [Nitrospirota bacterium]
MAGFPSSGLCHRSTGVDKPVERFFAPCPRGLEGVLAAELEELGARDLAATAGGVGFAGPFRLCYRVNLESRSASRVLWRVFHGRYRTEQDVYQATYDLPWRDWFSTSRTIKIKVSAQHCPLTSLDYTTLKIKDAVCDKFRAATGARPSVDTRRPDVRIDAFLDDQHVTLYLDTSGEPLFKRGLRKASGEAPLRENLAAGILRLSGWTPEQTLLDPMCGGGTILMEAVLMARLIAPGLGRRFAFEKLHNFDSKTWRDLCEASRASQIPKAAPAIYGSDRDRRTLQAAHANFDAAGLADAVVLAQADVLDVKPPAAAGVIVTNPPYGVRLGDQAVLAEFYPRLGDALKRNFTGWRAYLFTADLRLPKLIGLAPSRRTPLFNGALECRLFEFKLVRGTMRRPRGAARAGP